MEDRGVRERDRGQDGQDRAAAAEPGRQGRGREAAATGKSIDNSTGWSMRCFSMHSVFLKLKLVQGDLSGGTKPPVDFKTKVPLWPDQARPHQATA